MKKFVFSSILSILSVLVLDAQENSSVDVLLKDISKTKHYPIKKIDREKLKWTDEVIFGHPEWNDFSWSVRNDSVKKYLTEKDFAFIEAQYRADIDSLWATNELKIFKIVGQSDLDKIAHRSMKRKKMKRNYSYAFSTPLFSVDGKYVLIKEYFYCGLMCSTGSTVLYSRSEERKEWIKILEWNVFSS